MDRNNYIEIHPTQAQVAKFSFHHPSKYLNQNFSPQLQYYPWRIYKYHVNPETVKIKNTSLGNGSKVSKISNFVVLSFSVVTNDLT
jgi:hypothetical protein